MSTETQLHQEFMQLEAARQREQDDLDYFMAMYGPHVTVKRYRSDDIETNSTNRSGNRFRNQQTKEQTT